MTNNGTVPENNAAQPDKSTGKYVFDKASGKVIKVSDEIPSLAKQELGGVCPHTGHVCGGGCSH